METVMKSFGVRISDKLLVVLPDIRRFSAARYSIFLCNPLVVYFHCLFFLSFYNNLYKMKGGQSATASYKCEIKTEQRIGRKVRGSCFD